MSQSWITRFWLALYHSNFSAYRLAPSPLPARMSFFRFYEARQQRLGARHAAGNVEVYRQVLVEPLDGVVGIPVHAAVDGARAEADDVFRTLHLLVGADCPLEGLGRQVAGDDEQVGLARRRPPLHAVAVGIEARRHQRAHFDGAAAGAEAENPDRFGARPVEHVLDDLDVGPVHHRRRRFAVVIAQRLDLELDPVGPLDHAFQQFFFHSILTPARSKERPAAPPRSGTSGSTGRRGSAGRRRRRRPTIDRSRKP